MEGFVYRDKKLLRCGYTTGTCAALAARAAVGFLITGKAPESSSVLTPLGKWIEVPVECPEREQGPDGPVWAKCGVRKDAGDDYDVTDGLLIVCRAEFAEPGEQNPGAAFEKVYSDSEADPLQPYVEITGGEGIGTVTKKGLNQPVGQAAINEVPRRMIREAVCGILEEAGVSKPVRITVSAPEGRRAAQKTFNPILGITGGISILGTTGIVEPMSDDALVETIHAHMKVLAAAGRRYLAAAPGNMGVEAFCEYLYGKSVNGDKPGNDEWILCSNFIGRTIDLAAECGFSGLLLAGHLGKLVKLGNGIMNTHSREGDGRIDTLISCGLEAGAESSLLRKIQAANTTEEAMGIYGEEAFLEPVVQILLNRIEAHMKRRAPESLKTGVVLFSLETGYLGETAAAGELMERIKDEHGRGQNQGEI